MCYMKHAASNRKPNEKAKSITKKPVLKNNGKATKSVEKKYMSIVSTGQNLKLKAAKKIASKKPAQTVKTTAKKSEPFKSAKAIKSKVVEKIQPTIRKANANSSGKKMKSAGEKNKAITNKSSVKTNQKKAKPVVLSLIHI